MFRMSVPEFVSWMLLVPLWPPRVWLLNVRLVGLSVAFGAMPVPDRVIACGLPAASSVTLTLALFAPAVVGANCTPRKQELPALRLLAPWGHTGEPLVSA